MLISPKQKRHLLAF
jgi:hypothetical protein